MHYKLIVASAALFVCAQFVPAADAATKPDPHRKEVSAYLASLPAADLPVFNQDQALALITMPLACIDHPQAVPEQRQEYIWIHDAKAHLVDSYDKNRAFYGCFDWHSAVNSTWTMVALVKQFPDLPVARLVHEKLKDHLGKTNIEGEMEFFKTAKNFEVPYGYAWLLKLYAEMLTWEDPQAKTYAQNMAPMAQQFSKKLTEYFTSLPFPTRAGMHPNTAFSIGLVLDYTEVIADQPLRDAALKAANKFFLNDQSCPTAYEPGGTEFLSPCLAEAQLMARILDRDHFLTWFNAFLPAVYSDAFKPLTIPVDVTGITKPDLLGGKSHLIGLAFQRAAAMLEIANRLPTDDDRVPVYRRLAAINARSGYKAMADAGYFGSHWLGTYAVLCSRAMTQAAAVPVAAAAKK